jgi:mono/diheme cytochrome c family protein
MMIATPNRIALATGAGFALILGACAMQAEMPLPDEGARLFAENCVVCHGETAMGGMVDVRGMVAADLTGISARNGGDFPRAQVLSVIDGYGRMSHEGRAMPEFGALLEGETVPVEVDGGLTPTPRPLAALLVYLESIQVQ